MNHDFCLRGFFETNPGVSPNKHHTSLANISTADWNLFSLELDILGKNGCKPPNPTHANHRLNDDAHSLLAPNLCVCFHLQNPCIFV